MKNEDKIVEPLADSLKRLDRVVDAQTETNKRLDLTIGRLDDTNARLERLELGFERHEKVINRIENELVKLNMQTGQNTRAIYTLAEKVEGVADLHNRMVKLERAVFK